MTSLVHIGYGKELQMGNTSGTFLLQVKSLTSVSRAGNWVMLKMLLLYSISYVFVVKQRCSKHVSDKQFLGLDLSL